MSKKLSGLCIFIFIIFIASFFSDIKCQWKENPNQILTDNEVKSEIEIKNQRVIEFLYKEDLSGIVLTQVRNFAWITAGVATNQIVLNSDVGAASLLHMKDGKK